MLENNDSFITKEIETKTKSKDFKGKKIITFGTFDLFHNGHSKIINHALRIAGKPENLIIAVSSDKWNKLKNKESFQSQKERMNLVKKQYPKSKVILEDHENPEESWPFLWDEYDVELIVMGGDHLENLSYINNEITPNGKQMKIVFFERTPNISSSILRDLEKKQ